MADGNLDRMFARHGVPVIKTSKQYLPSSYPKKKKVKWPVKAKKVNKPKKAKKKYLPYVPPEVIARKIREVYGENDFNINDHKEALLKWKAKKQE